ncbi:MAG: hypothetical protein K2X47_07780 [Bdellovibrionales bacterium]|nr:hypothetical protein [Bdellovibrionales bacterium]
MTFAPKIGHVFFGALFLFSPSLHSEEIQITESKIQELTRALPRTEKAMTLYHWTSLETWLRWTAQGEVQPEEFQNLLKNSKGMAAGGGLYLASDSDSSRKFGDYALKVYIPKGTILYDPKVVQKILGLEDDLDDAQRSQLGQKIDFIHQTQNTKARVWWITYSHALVKRRGNIIPFKNAHPSKIPFGGGFTTNFEKDFQYLQRQGPSATYAKRLMTILFARNVHGFLEALYGSPENLEKVMPASELSRVEAAMKKWLFRPPESLDKMNVQNLKKEEWVQNQLALLPVLFSDFTGAAKATFARTQPRVSKTLILDPFQTEALRQNENLTIQIQQSDGWRTAVKIQYADPTTLDTKLTAFLEKLYDTILETDPESEDEQATEENPWADRLREMISLSPFSNSNDMIIRAYFSILTRANPNFTITPPIKVFPTSKVASPAVLHTLIFQQAEDPLILSFSKQQKDILSGISFAALRVAHGIVAETADAERFRRNASYQDLPEQSALVEVYRTTLDPKTPGALVQNPRALLQKLATGDLEGLQEFVSKQTFWFSEYKMVPEVVQSWSKAGRMDLVTKTMDLFLNMASTQRMSLGVFAKATKADFAPLRTRTEWIQALLSAFPSVELDVEHDDEDDENWGLAFPSIVSNSSIYKKDEFLKQVVGQYVMEKHFKPILEMAMAGKFDELDKKYGGMAFDSDQIQRALQLPRSWVISFFTDLIQAVSGNVPEKIRLDVGDALFRSTLLSGSTNDASFREGLKVIQSYLRLLKADAFGDGKLSGGDSFASTTFTATSKLFYAKKISIDVVREAIQVMIVTPNGHWVKSPHAMISLFEQISKTAPDALQNEIHWLAKNLEAIVPDPDDRKGYQERIDKIIKPLPEGVSRALSLSAHTGAPNAQPPACSPLASGK